MSLWRVVLNIFPSQFCGSSAVQILKIFLVFAPNAQSIFINIHAIRTLNIELNKIWFRELIQSKHLLVTQIDSVASSGG